MESQNTLRQRIAKAIKSNDKQELLRLKDLLKKEIWLSSFNGSIPPSAWLQDNPMIKFID